MTRAPVRTCIGCRGRRPKSQLVRLVREPDGLVGLDRSGTAPGRGAYVCPGRGCVATALKQGRLAHAFRGRAEARSELLAWAQGMQPTVLLSG
ncbi:MAG: YlxR family protein [Candidatus Rokubacteria bacterium]|nr:YlxR family protein [Candidatus Rokubacteria bacterium]